jgi:hypothetical protein
MEHKVLMVISSKIEERRQQLIDAIGDGSAKDFPEYRYLCGTIRGLDTALLEINDLLRRFKDMDDE